MDCQLLEGFDLSAKRDGFCAAASAADAQVAEPITNKETIRVRRFTILLIDSIRGGVARM
jgi:hypothetical protein